MKRMFVAAALLLALPAVTPYPAAAQDAIGGAIVGGVVGGVIGGAATGRAEGAIVGAVIGGVAGAAIGAEAERRRGYYWHRGVCYKHVQGGYVRVSSRRCGF
ncbi:MAG TPA: glycine zipper domain-containing protein [Xanthobacteraceae bacterium]|nr:glycine zipper domain-containing protein [Xanthobacteraceae bacterium]